MLLSVAASSGMSSSLSEYRLFIDPQYLEMLYEDPYSEAEYPGTLECDDWSAECMVRFRGKSSLAFPKKSWAISFPDQSITGRQRINLNAEYMDPGMMRNCIAMRASRLLGFPASRTEHVRFFVNDEYMGVFLEVERVDGGLFSRYGYDSVALFKGFNEGARFMPLVSGEHLASSYRARSYSGPLYHHLHSLVNLIHSGASPLPVDCDNLMAYYAVSLGLMDRDAGSNNYYFMLASDGMWRVFPWDRGSCLGGLGDGVFHPELAHSDYLMYFKTNSLYQRLLENDDCVTTLENHLEQVAVLLDEEIPQLIDSIYETIAPDLYADPSNPWTPGEMDQARDDLLWFCEERSDFMEENSVIPARPEIWNLSLGRPWLEAGDTTYISLEANDIYTLVRVRWIQGESTYYKFLKHRVGTNLWGGVFTMPDGYSWLPLDICFRKLGQERLTFYYPAHSLDMFSFFPSASPCYVNPSPGCYPPVSPGSFSLGNPRLYGPLLWALPLVNSSGHNIDISCCGLRLGNSPHSIFIPPETVLHPMDTLFITSSLESFSLEFSGRSAVGDFPCEAPDNGTITMFDPLWQDLWTMDIPVLEDYSGSTAGLVITEICHTQPANCMLGDWVELCNLSPDPVDAGGHLISDIDGNTSVINWNTPLEPGEFVILSREPELFSLLNPVDCPVGNLGFGIASSEDSISLRDRCGNPLQTVSWRNSADEVLGLIHPSLPPGLMSSWETSQYPGTPGAPNRLWNGGGAPLSASLLCANPLRSRCLLFRLTAMSYPVSALIMDLTGRTITPQHLLEPIEEQHSITLPPSLPAGMYILFLQSPEETVSVKFVLLR